MHFFPVTVMPKEEYQKIPSGNREFGRVKHNQASIDAERPADLTYLAWQHADFSLPGTIPQRLESRNEACRAVQRQGRLLDLAWQRADLNPGDDGFVRIVPVPETRAQREESLADLPDLAPLRRQFSPEADLPEDFPLRCHLSSEDDAFDLTTPQNYALHSRVGFVPREQYDRWKEADAKRTSSRRALRRGRLPPVRNCVSHDLISIDFGIIYYFYYFSYFLAILQSISHNVTINQSTLYYVGELVLGLSRKTSMNS